MVLSRLFVFNPSNQASGCRGSGSSSFYHQAVNSVLTRAVSWSFGDSRSREAAPLGPAVGNKMTYRMIFSVTMKKHQHRGSAHRWLSATQTKSRLLRPRRSHDSSPGRDGGTKSTTENKRLAGQWRLRRNNKTHYSVYLQGMTLILSPPLDPPHPTLPTLPLRGTEGDRKPRLRQQ